MFNNNPKGMQQDANDTLKIIGADGQEITNLDISDYVKEKEFHKKIADLDHQISELDKQFIRHTNTSSAHNEHINYLVDQKLKEQQNVLTNNNQSNRAWHTSIWAIIVTILGIITSSCISFFF